MICIFGDKNMLLKNWHIVTGCKGEVNEKNKKKKRKEKAKIIIKRINETNKMNKTECRYSRTLFVSVDEELKPVQ